MKGKQMPRLIQTFPNPIGSGVVIWNGNSFEDIDAEVLSYLMTNQPQGWSDDLTDYIDEVTEGGRHPVENASRQIAVQGVIDFCGCNNDTPRILEVGCSSGFLLRDLRSRIPRAAMCGADIIDEPLARLARALRTEHIPMPLLRFDLSCSPLEEAGFDVIIALNVLEHIEDHTSAAAEVYRMLKPGGVFIVEVPAGSGLYDDYDRELHHYRRYDPKALDELLKTVGFKKQKLSHLGFFVYPAFWIIKKLRSCWNSASRQDKTRQDKTRQDKTRQDKTRQDKTRPSILSRKMNTASAGILFRIIFAVELCLGHFINWPFGIRCTGVYKKL